MAASPGYRPFSPVFVSGYMQELLKNERYRKEIKVKAREVEERDLALQAKEYEEGLIASPTQTLATGHAAATPFGKAEVSEDPVSSGGSFQPGSWAPSESKK